MNRIRVSVSLFLSVLLASSLLAQEPLLSVDTDPVAAAPNASVLRLIRFNGTARGAQGQPLAGVVGVTFAFYAEQEGGAPLWLETQNVSLDPQGRYTALLGAMSNDGLPLEIFSSGEARWLGIQVQGQPEQPRVLLVSVPYALKAAEAETLSGKTAADFVLSEQLTTQVEEEINTQIESQGLITTEEAGTLAQVSGSGTAGQIAKFTSSTAVGNSVINENNGNIAIGFSNAQQKLAVGVGAAGGSALNLTNLNNQDLQVILSAAADPDRVALIGPATPTNLALGVGGTERMRITNAGNIGIGFKTPVQRLVVASKPVGGPTVTVTNGANQDLQLSVSGRNAGDRVAMVAPSTGTNLALGVGGTEKMRITNAGDVGIGISTPQGRLHAFSNSGGILRVSGPVNSADAATLQLFESPTTALGMQIKYIGEINDRIEFQNESGNTQVSIGRNSGDLKATGDISADGVGVVKAAVFAESCSTSGSSIVRSFNNVNTSAITITDGASAGECTVTFPFDMSDRYVVGSAGGTTRGLGLIQSGNDVDVRRYSTSTDTSISGQFYLLVY